MFEMPTLNTYLVVLVSLVLMATNLMLKTYFQSRKFRNLKQYEKQVFYSIRDKNYSKFQTLFKQHNIDPNLSDINGVTLLIYAVNMFSKKEQDIDKEMRFINYLLNCKDIKINKQYSQGNNAFITAVHWNKLHVVKLLLNYQVDLNHVIQKLNMNALSSSLIKNNLEMSKLLLDNGADPIKARQLLDKANSYHFLDHQSQKLLQKHIGWKTGGFQFAFVYETLKCKQNNSDGDCQLDQNQQMIAKMSRYQFQHVMKNFLI